MRILLIIAVLSVLSGCVTFKGFNTASRAKGFDYSQSPRISSAVLNACNDPICLLDLAANEIKDAKPIEKEISYSIFAATYLKLNREKDGLHFLDKVKSKKVLDTFYGSFGSINKGKINKFLADTQRWQSAEIPLPKVLLGRHDKFDKLFATFLIINRQYEDALRVIDTLDHTLSKNAIYYQLTQAMVKEKRFEDAWKLAGKLKFGTKKQNKAKAITLVLHGQYRAGEKKEALDKLAGLTSTFEINSAKAGIAIAMAEDGHEEDALRLLDEIDKQNIRGVGYGGMIIHAAKKGELDTVRSLLEHADGKKIKASFYTKILSAFAKAGHIDTAIEFAGSIPSDIATIYALAELGAITKDEKYFRQALILATEGKKASSVRKRSFGIASKMAQAGFLKEAILTLHNYDNEKIRPLVRLLVFSSVFGSITVPTDPVEVVDLAELDMSLSEPSEYKQILKINARFMLVDRSKIEAIDKYLALVAQVQKKSDRDYLQGRIIPHLAFLGEFEKANNLIAGMDYTVHRISAMIRFANFHIFKKTLGTI